MTSKLGLLILLSLLSSFSLFAEPSAKDRSASEISDLQLRHEYLESLAKLVQEELDAHISEVKERYSDRIGRFENFNEGSPMDFYGFFAVLAGFHDGGAYDHRGGGL